MPSQGLKVWSVRLFDRPWTKGSALQSGSDETWNPGSVYFMLGEKVEEILPNLKFSNKEREQELQDGQPRVFLKEIPMFKASLRSVLEKSGLRFLY